MGEEQGRDEAGAAGGGADNGQAREASHRVRHDGWTGEKQRGFLDALAETGNVRDACRRVGLSNTSAYRLRRNDPQFGRDWDAAQARAAVSLEAIAFQRATEGAEEVVIRNGEEVSRRRKPSDMLLKLLLQAANPEKYGRIGPNASVKAREEIEARVKEIEESAYRRAWAALVMEYNYQFELVGVRVWFWRKLASMHFALCDRPRCRECHPERFDPNLPEALTWPAADHQPIPSPRAWLDGVREEVAAERLRANLEGRHTRIDTAPMPEPTRNPNYVVPPPPPIAAIPDPLTSPPAEVLRHGFVEIGPEEPGEADWSTGTGVPRRPRDQYGAAIVQGEAPAMSDEARQIWEEMMMAAQPTGAARPAAAGGSGGAGGSGVAGAA